MAGSAFAGGVFSISPRSLRISRYSLIGLVAFWCADILLFSHVNFSTDTGAADSSSDGDFMLGITLISGVCEIAGASAKGRGGRGGAIPRRVRC